jgi:hypothetical protein
MFWEAAEQTEGAMTGETGCLELLSQHSRLAGRSNLRPPANTSLRHAVLKQARVDNG